MTVRFPWKRHKGETRSGTNHTKGRCDTVYSDWFQNSFVEDLVKCQYEVGSGGTDPTFLRCLYYVSSQRGDLDFAENNIR